MEGASSGRVRLVKEGYASPPATTEKKGVGRARGALYHLLQRYPLPRDRPGDGRAARTARGRGGLPLFADLLRPDALQHRLPARGDTARPALRRDFQELRGS